MNAKRVWNLLTAGVCITMLAATIAVLVKIDAIPAAQKIGVALNCMVLLGVCWIILPKPSGVST
jgi:hypothetical protein